VATPRCGGAFMRYLSLGVVVCSLKSNGFDMYIYTRAVIDDQSGTRSTAFQSHANVFSPTRHVFTAEGLVCTGSLYFKCLTGKSGCKTRPLLQVLHWKFRLPVVDWPYQLDTVKPGFQCLAGLHLQFCNCLWQLQNTS
jgi:hypothetical protein